MCRCASCQDATLLIESFLDVVPSSRGGSVPGDREAQLYDALVLEGGNIRHVAERGHVPIANAGGDVARIGSQRQTSRSRNVDVIADANVRPPSICLSAATGSKDARRGHSGSDAEVESAPVPGIEASDALQRENG